MKSRIERTRPLHPRPASPWPAASRSKRRARFSATHDRLPSRPLLDTKPLQPIVDRETNPLPVVIVFAAAVAVYPLAVVLDLNLAIGWLGSAIGAFAIASILAVGAFRLIGR